MNDTAATPRASAPVAAIGEPGRIDWLFRDALRRREIHPLMRLLQLHRGQDATPPAETDPPAPTRA